MDSKTTIVLDGSRLSVEEVNILACNPKATVKIAVSALAGVKKAQAFLEGELNKKIIYGVNTGFGPMASHIIGRHQVTMLQENLIHSHAVGMGNPLPERYVLAAMVVRLNALVKGYSGVSPDLIKQLQAFINKRIIPVIPEHGAVGTSGDLVQLAHIALALIGEGEVFYKGKRQEARQVLRRLHIPPYKVRPKEGLALINGTSMMTGIAALLAVWAERLVGIAI